MTREIILDTETTGLDPARGDRILEIACLEMIDDKLTPNTFYKLIDPQRDVPMEATRVHGIDAAKLKGQPKFAEVMDEFLAFVGDSPLVIHNAPFDMGFLNHELRRAGRQPLFNKAVDTLPMARAKFPGAPASLDRLCDRFEIDRSNRVFHGALVDCELLAEVYLALTGRRKGAQNGLDFGVARAEPRRSPGVEAARTASSVEAPALRRPGPRPALLSDSESAAHEAFVKTLGEGALWRKG